jgi:hypothetical protein
MSSDASTEVLSGKRESATQNASYSARMGPADEPAMN